MLNVDVCFVSRKKRDPRKDNRMDFNRKHQIIQSL